MKEIRKKIANIMSVIYGIGVMVSLFAGGLSFLGYLVALIIGGQTATEICVFIYKTLYPILFYFSSSVVLLGLIKMYIAGEKSMVPGNKYKKQDKHQTES